MFICTECDKDYNKYSNIRRIDPKLREEDYHKRRSYRLKRLGMTEEDYNDLLEYQNNTCAICFRNFNEVGAIHLDHNHKTGKPRGLLCSRCNNGIGMFEDNPDLLVRAISYLNHPVYLDFMLDKEEIW